MCAFVEKAHWNKIFLLPYELFIISIMFFFFVEMENDIPMFEYSLLYFKNSLR